MLKQIYKYMEDDITAKTMEFMGYMCAENNFSIMFCLQGQTSYRNNANIFPYKLIFFFFKMKNKLIRRFPETYSDTNILTLFHRCFLFCKGKCIEIASSTTTVYLI